MVLSTFTLVTDTSKEAQEVRVLDKISCICYPIQFQKNKNKNILALLDFGSMVNAMTLAYIAKLGLKMQKSNIDTQKIDESSLDT